MPEHDTFDLDAAFARLEQDIAGVSSPRGAGLAVTTARRRRRTTVGAIAAVTVLAVGGVAIAQGAGHDESVSPTHQLPAPALLDGPHLSAATAGWTPAWEPGTQQAKETLDQTFGGACFAGVPGVPTGQIAIHSFGNSHGDLAVAVMSDFGSRTTAANAGWRRLNRQLDTCSGAQRISSFGDPSQARERTYRVVPTENESAPQYVWIVSTGKAIGLLKILDQSDALPASNDRPVADALLAALQDPASFDQPAKASSNGHLSRIDPTKTLGQVWAEDFGPALAGWDNPWQPQLTHVTGPEMPPCAGEIDSDATGATEMVNVGRNGHEWVGWLQDEAAATTAVAQLQQSMASCATPYTFHTVSLPDGRPVLVGVGQQEVVWIERVASHVLLVHIPAGSTPPPDSVSLKVGAVLEHVLEEPATTTMAPDGKTKVPAWMKQEISAAPTFGP